MDTKVKSVDGTLKKRSEVVYIKGKYYIKGKDATIIGDTYIRNDSDRLVYDHAIESFSLIDDMGRATFDAGLSGLRMSIPSKAIGIVDYDKTTNTFVIGYFSLSLDKFGYFKGTESTKFILSEKNKNLKSAYEDTVYNYSHIIIMDESIMEKAELVQTKHKEYLVEKGTELSSYSNHAGGRYSVPKTYGANILIQGFDKYFKKNYQALNKMYPKSSLIKDIGKYSYGVEFETWEGRIPERFLWQTGLMPLFDGSLRHDDRCGHEYATIPLTGEPGLKSLRRHCELLQEFGYMNENCSLHIHLGNINRDEVTAMKIYHTLYALQDEFYAMYPSILRKSSSFKKQDYCNPIPKLDNFADLVDMTSCGVMPESKFKFGMPHPKDREQSRKWEIQCRYAIFNFVPYLFTDRGTVEIRISTPTSNYNKVAALLLMFIAAIRFAEESKEIPDKLTLKDVLMHSMSSNVMEALMPYIDHRKKNLSKYTTSSGRVRYLELKDDATNDGIIYKGEPILF